MMGSHWVLLGRDGLWSRRSLAAFHTCFHPECTGSGHCLSGGICADCAQVNPTWAAQLSQKQEWAGPDDTVVDCGRVQ